VSIAFVRREQRPVAGMSPEGYSDYPHDDRLKIGTGMELISGWNQPKMHFYQIHE